MSDAMIAICVGFVSLFVVCFSLSQFQLLMLFGVIPLFVKNTFSPDSLGFVYPRVLCGRHRKK